MYYTPNAKKFKVQEFFPLETIRDHRESGMSDNSIWRLMDERILITSERLQARYGTMVINDYLWGGKNQYRGFRPFKSLFDKQYFLEAGLIQPSWSTFTSQHCLGRGIDAKFKYHPAEKIRQDILEQPTHPDFIYITCIEDGVSWLHFDCRSWDKSKNGILVVKP